MYGLPQEERLRLNKMAAEAITAAAYTEQVRCLRPGTQCLPLNTMCNFSSVCCNAFDGRQAVEQVLESHGEQLNMHISLHKMREIATA